MTGFCSVSYSAFAFGIRYPNYVVWPFTRNVVSIDPRFGGTVTATDDQPFEPRTAQFTRSTSTKRIHISLSYVPSFCHSLLVLYWWKSYQLPIVSTDIMNSGNDESADPYLAWLTVFWEGLPRLANFFTWRVIHMCAVSFHMPTPPNLNYKSGHTTIWLRSSVWCQMQWNYLA